MTRKILTSIVQRLVNLVSLDISGHIMLDNCTVPHFEEAMGRPRWATNTTVSACLRIASAYSSSLSPFSSFSIEPCKSSIYPFQELKRPLQFLGLYDTTLCNVTHIPAYKVPLRVQCKESISCSVHTVQPGTENTQQTQLPTLPSRAQICVSVVGEWVQERRPGLERHRGVHRVSPRARPQSHQSTV